MSILTPPELAFTGTGVARASYTSDFVVVVTAVDSVLVLEMEQKVDAAAEMSEITSSSMGFKTGLL